MEDAAAKVDFGFSFNAEKLEDTPKVLIPLRFAWTPEETKPQWLVRPHRLGGNERASVDRSWKDNIRMRLEAVMSDSERLPASPKPDPYCAFRSDRERRVALISRDVRYVIVVAIVSIGGYEIPWRALAQLLGYAA
jgi:hypothetical protein